MSRRILPNTDVVFTPATSTISIPKLIRREKFLLITNSTTGQVIYNFSDPALGFYTHTFDYTNAVKGKTIVTLEYNCAAMNANDNIQIVYDEDNESFEPAPYLTDAVGKLRVAPPKSLIDTDFEYSVQNSKWESLTLINNYPGFFGRATGGNSFELLSVVGNGASPKSTITVTTTSAHGLNSGDVVSVQECINNLAEGTFLVFPTSSTTFTYTAKGKVTGDVIDGTLTTVYGGGIFDNAHIMGGNTGTLGSWTAVSDQATPSRITVTTPTPHGLLPGTPILITQKVGSNFYGNFFIDTVSTPTSFSFMADNQLINPIDTNTQAVYAKPEGYVEHRPMDGGVILSTGNNVCGTQTIRQTRRYFRYQSGKSIQFSTGTKFTPTFEIEYIAASGIVAGPTDITVQTLTNHNLQPGAYVKIEYIAASGIVAGPTDITVVTLTNHNLQPGAYVKIEGVEVTGNYNPFNGIFRINTIVDQQTFKVTVNFTQTINAIDQIPGGVNVFATAYKWKGASTRAGMFSEQDGFFFEYDGQTIHAVRQWSTQELRGDINVTKYSNVVTGNLTIFRKQLVIGDKVVIRGQSYRVIGIPTDTTLYISPAYRGTSQVGVKYRKTQQIKVPQSQWNIDKMDGTGPSGHFFDASKMQMTFIDYSWYGAGTIRFGFRAQDGKIQWVHNMPQNNVNVQAYQRSGNLPARYECINEPTKYARVISGGTAISGSAIYPQDTTIYIDNVTNWPTDGYILIQDNNYCEIAQFTAIGSYNSSVKGYPLTLIRRQPYVTYYSGTAYNLNGTYVQATFTPDATIPGGSGTSQVACMVISQECAPVMTHWGSSVIMDGGFDDDASFIFTAGMQRYLQVGGSGSISATIVSRATTGGVATLTTSAPHTLQAGYNATISGVNDVSTIIYKQLTSNVATITTSAAHKHRSGQTITISGVDTIFNGTWTITGVTTTTVNFTRTAGNVPLTSVLNGSAVTSSYYNGTFAITAVGSNTLSFALAIPDEVATAVNPNGAVVQTFGATQQARPLISLRLAPSVDNGIARNFGLRELMNTMQLKLWNMNILAQGQFLIEGILNPVSLNGVTIPTDWQLTRVGSGSLAQIIYHDGTGTQGTTVTSPTNTISGGDRIFAFYTENAGGTNYSVTRVDLTKVRDLGNSILNGDGSTSCPGFPNGPDILTIQATNLGSAAANISATLSWTEAQA